MSVVPLLLAALRPALASEGTFPGPEAMAAFEGNLRSGYAFGSVTSSSAAGRVNPVARVTVSHLYYAYAAETGGTLVQSPGIGLGVGIRWRPKRFSLSTLVGYEARYTMEFEDGGERFARADHGVSLSADAYLQADPQLAFALSGYFGFAQDYVWARALAKRQIIPLVGSSITQFSLGLDSTVHGNDLVRGVDGGLLTELSVPGVAMTLGLRLGVGREIQAGADPALIAAVGTSIYKSF